MTHPGISSLALIGRTVFVCSGMCSAAAYAEEPSLSTGALAQVREVDPKRLSVLCPNQFDQSFPTSGPAQTTWRICWHEVAGSQGTRTLQRACRRAPKERSPDTGVRGPANRQLPSRARRDRWPLLASRRDAPTMRGTARQRAAGGGLLNALDGIATRESSGLDLSARSTISAAVQSRMGEPPGRVVSFRTGQTCPRCRFHDHCGCGIGPEQGPVEGKSPRQVVPFAGHGSGGPRVARRRFERRQGGLSPRVKVGLGIEGEAASRVKSSFQDFHWLRSAQPLPPCGPTAQSVTIAPQQCVVSLISQRWWRAL
jgi:hypothetical protein